MSSIYLINNILLLPTRVLVKCRSLTHLIEVKRQENHLVFPYTLEYGEKTIVKRLKSLEDVGLGYIKLGQNSSSLSGGENQRVKLAYFIGQEKQEPTLFIFDEPTTGLHFHDISRLLSAFSALIERGHTILVIEHNMEVIKSADHVIDMGPDGGDRGGEVVCVGTPEEIAQCEKSLTGKFLKAKL